MKVLLILLVFWFNKISSEPIDRKQSNPRIKNECLIEYGIEPDINYNNQEGISPLTDEQIYCVAACIYRDYGIMKPDGTIDSEKAEAYFGPDETEEKMIFFAVLNACHDEKVHCSLVQCMFRELRHYERNFSNPKTVLQGILSGNTMVEFA